MKELPVLALVQGGYYLIAGLWPVVSMRSFEAVMGPRREHWLMRTHSWMLAAVGAVLVWAGLRRSRAAEVPAAGIGTALGLALPESYYIASGRIPKTYLLDALPQWAFALAWLAGLRKR